MPVRTDDSLNHSYVRPLVIVVWLAALFAVPPLVDQDEDTLFAIVVLVFPLWAVVVSIRLALKRRFAMALLWLGLLPLGVLVIQTGLLAGNLWLAGGFSPTLVEAIEQAKSGHVPREPVEATPYAAYIETGSYFELAQGLAYDPEGKLETMLELAPEDRPGEWLDRMPRAFSCHGGARHVSGHLWRTRLDRLQCSR